MVHRARVYVETSIVSYLTSRPSRDLLVAAHQQITREWWDGRNAFELCVSQFVVDEARAGDVDAGLRRLDALQNLTILEMIDDAVELANRLVTYGGLPEKARVDAIHIAIAAVHGMDFLITWNCKHIANASTRATIERLCRGSGFEPPVICTPLELAKE
jgi:PIN domain